MNLPQDLYMLPESSHAFIGGEFRSMWDRMQGSHESFALL